VTTSIAPCRVRIWAGAVGMALAVRGLMRFERPGLALVLGVVVGASACGSVLVEPTDACRQLGEAACRLRSDCAVGACASCNSGPTFITCYDPASEAGPKCTGIACPAPCATLDEASCKTRTDCRADSCPNCTGGSSFFRCAAADDPLSVGCIAIPCPAPCAVATTKEACEARSDCHAVFVDDRACACAGLGCCARFSRCADGASAVCKAPPITCDAVAPHCEGPYVVAYSDSCYEGCVQSSDCAVN
jgi:hypothetical protein